MVVYLCKKCGEPNFLTPHTFWNITDFRAKCEKCEMINTITLLFQKPDVIWFVANSRLD